MKIKQYDIWLANLNPQIGTEPGKIRPVVVIQTNMLNDIHPSTIVCPVTSKVNLDINLLRVHLKKSQLDQVSDILLDQIRAIDNVLLIKKIGTLTKDQKEKTRENLRIILDLDVF